MKIAVTGSGGQLGSELCRQLGRQAVALDLPEFDLTRRVEVIRRLEQLRPDVVINTAAYTHVDKAEDEVDLCRAVNVEGVAYLVEACRRLNCTLVEISTDYVFGGDRRPAGPYRESDAPAPQGVYAQSKLEGEHRAAGWEKHLIVRTCGLYGQPGPRSSGNFVQTMLRLAERRKRLRVVHDQRCTPSYVAHVARAVLFLVDSEARGTYHVVNAGETTWYEFATEIFRLRGLEVELEPISTVEYGAEYGVTAPRPGYSVLDTSKYHAMPGAPPMHRWQEALAEYLQCRGG